MVTAIGSDLHMRAGAGRVHPVLLSSFPRTVNPYSCYTAMFPLEIFEKFNSGIGTISGGGDVIPGEELPANSNLERSISFHPTISFFPVEKNPTKT